jgi:hypothetical protein
MEKSFFFFLYCSFFLFKIHFPSSRSDFVLRAGLASVPISFCAPSSISAKCASQVTGLRFSLPPVVFRCPIFHSSRCSVRSSDFLCGDFVLAQRHFQLRSCSEHAPVLFGTWRSSIFVLPLRISSCRSIFPLPLKIFPRCLVLCLGLVLVCSCESLCGCFLLCAVRLSRRGFVLGSEICFVCSRACFPRRIWWSPF